MDGQPLPPGKYTRVFHDDFEDGTIGKWGNGGASVTQVSPHSGTYAAIGGWNGEVIWTDPDSLRALELPSWKYSTEYLARFWIRLDADVDLAPGKKYFRLPWANESQGNELVWADLYGDNSFSTFTQIDGSTLDTGWSCGSLADHAWHRVEIFIRDATDGAIRMWLDGKELACDNSGGFHFPYFGNTHQNAGGWDNFYWPSNWSSNPGWEHDANNHIYLDDVEIFSDDASGTPSTGALVDATVRAL